MLLDTPVRLDWEGFVANLRREGEPERVYNIEVRIDDEIVEGLNEQFGLDSGIDRDDHYRLRRDIAVYRFLGLEMLRCVVEDFHFPHPGADHDEWLGGRAPMIRSWEDFEKYPWPDPDQADLSDYEWLECNLPDDMSVFVPHAQLLFLNVNFLLGFERLGMLMYDDAGLVDAVVERVGQIHFRQTELLCQFDCVKALFGADDWGWKSGTLVDPNWMIEKICPWFQKYAALAHDSGRLFLLHSCGNIEALMPTLLDQVKIDGRHSYENQILPVSEAKRRYGQRIAILGGIDVDVLCRSDEQSIRRNVRKVLEVCMIGGGYCLGTGNSVAKYVPLDNYLIMLDEGRRFLR